MRGDLHMSKLLGVRAGRAAFLILALITAAFVVGVPGSGQRAAANSPETETSFASVVKAAKADLHPDSRRITNGSETEPYEYPSVVALVQKGASDLQGQSCGATAISDRWLLTAAHCLWELPANVPAASIEVDAVVGAWYLPLELGARMEICSFTTHPGFDYFDFVSPDIAVVELCEPHFHPAAGLPANAAVDGAGVIAQAVGWGLHEGGAYDGELHAGTVSVMSNAECQQSATSQFPFDGAAEICASGANGSIDACNGDSGGPLYNGTTVIGIVIYGPEAVCEGPAPGIYTRVSAYLPWIESITGITPGMQFPGIPCADAYATHIGTLEADVITTTDRGDVVAAFSGDDVVTTGDGVDLVCGGDGADIIGLGGGFDSALGGPGDDVIYGQTENDVIDGGEGDDKLRGGAGDDVVRGGDGSDDLNGGTGNDQVMGEGGDDRFVRGGTGDDMVDGGPGSEGVVAGNGGSDMVYGGEGDDPLVTGGPRPDTVSGGPGSDVVKGHKGADTLNGDDGDDMILGGHQADRIDGGAGIDTCIGGTTGQGAPEADEAVGCEGEIVSVP